MAKRITHSIEEQIEDWCKAQLRTEKYYTKTESMAAEISAALRKAPSKKGGDGRNFPDIQIFIEFEDLKRVPVMIEVKGTKGDFIKADSDGNILNEDTKGKPNYTNNFFIACAIEKRIKPFFNRDLKATWDRIKSMDIYLPVNDDHKPNPELIEHCINATKKVIISDLKEFIKTEHNAYLSVTSE